MKTDTNNIKRNTLRRMAAVAMLLIAFAVSAEAQFDSKCSGSPDGTHVFRYDHTSATCTSGGDNYYICKFCGRNRLGESVPALGHDWGEPFGDDVAPTCTTAGGKNHTCKRCGATELDNSVAALGHDWGEWTDVAAATCTVAAQHSHTCQRDGCGVSETCAYGDPLGHNWSDNWITVAPTCTEQGYTGHPCTRCDDVNKHKIVAALGHSWSADYHCIRCDFELPAIDYIKADGTEGSHQAIPITGTSEDDVVLGFENADTWYYLSGEFTPKSLRLIDRTANIILTAGCNITTLDGINAENGSLNIYGQSAYGILGSPIYAHDNINIYGGNVSANGNGLSAGGDITLGWTKTNNRFRANSICANSFGGVVNLAKAFTDGDGTLHTNANVGTLAGKTLTPAFLLSVGADNDYSDRTSGLDSWAGTDMTAAFQRTFNVGKASTICLPFPMTTVTGGDVYGFVGVTYNNTDGWVATMQQPISTTLAANTPYLFMPSGDSETTDVTFSGSLANVASIAAGETQASTEDGTWTFQGTYSRLAYETNESQSNPFSGKAFGFAASDAGQDVNDVKAGEFVRADAGAFIPAFRSFLKYEGNVLEARGTRGGEAGIPESITVRLIGKTGEIDGIGEIRLSTGEVTFDPNAWYDLNGRKLNGVPTVKGIYINGGHKVVIK